MNHIRFIFIVTFCFGVLALVNYGKLPKTFFQQDEWAVFGYHISADKLGLNLYNRLFIHEQETHMVPLSNLATLVQYRLFGLRFAPYGWIAVGLHFANTLLVFWLAMVLIKRRWLALLAGIFFLINSIPHQAITWVATTTGTAGSTTVFLLSFIAFIQYIQKKERPIWLLGLVMLLFLVSLGFKETTVFGFFLFPVVWVLLINKRRFRAGAHVGGAIFFSGLFYLLARFFILMQRPAISISPEVVAQPSLGVYLFRTVAVPIRVFVQSFLPEQFHLTMSRLLLRLAYPTFIIGGVPNPYLVESVAADIITLFALLGIATVVAGVGRYFQKTRQAHLSKALSVGFVFTLFSALPFVFVPGRAGYNALLDGRHLYLTSTFTSILAASILVGAIQILGKRKILIVALFVVVFTMSFYHIRKIRKDIDDQIAIGNLRQSILRTVIASAPNLPRRAVFYVESDRPYYGLQEPIVPFQSGFGQVLLVWYNANGADLPTCLFDREYLYVLLEENFKECQGRGFGYFRKTSTFNNALQTYHFQPNEIFAFRFISATNTFKDMTIEIRSKLDRFGSL